MAAPFRLDPTVIRHQIAQLQAAHPEVFAGDDEVLLADTIEGETDLKEFLDTIVNRILQAEAQAVGIEMLMATLRKRQGRYERRNEVLRTLAFKLMGEAGVRSLECTGASLSIRTGQPKVVITDEAALPDRLCRIKREPDKRLIREHLESGTVALAGAMLSNAEPVLTVRIK